MSFVLDLLQTKAWVMLPMECSLVFVVTSSKTLLIFHCASFAEDYLVLSGKEQFSGPVGCFSVGSGQLDTCSLPELHLGKLRRLNHPGASQAATLHHLSWGLEHKAKYLIIKGLSYWIVTE